MDYHGIFSALKELLNFCGMRRKSSIVAHHQEGWAVQILEHFKDSAEFSLMYAKRFFDKDVFAGFERLTNHAAM
ncbi:MAG: hypothetical protein AB9866_28680 [Syntrophobacteraceae bacterium]